MTPEITHRPGFSLAGVVQTGQSVKDIDIGSLWQVYLKSEPGIPNRVPGAWWELHVGVDDGKGIYTVMVGVEISQVGALPIEVSLKQIPAGRYAHFAHPMKEGSYGVAFQRVEEWEKSTGAAVKGFGLQLYDADFNPHDTEDSVLHIYIPLVD